MDVEDSSISQEVLDLLGFITDDDGDVYDPSVIPDYSGMFALIEGKHE